MNNKFLQSYIKSQQVEGRSKGRPLPPLKDLVGEYIQYILARTHHNVAQSARILHVSRTTLYNWLHRDGF